MALPPFKLEEFWKKYEFTAPYLLCPSDAESWSMYELLDMADPASKKLWDNLRLGYTETQGLPALREEIAQLYTSIHPDDILTLAGGEEGIYCTLRTLLAPNDHVIAVAPCYQSLVTLARDRGADLTVIMLDPKQQWKLSLDQLEQAFRPTTKLLVLTQPHNPTGTLLDRDVYEGLVELARQRGCYIFVDEMYRYMEIDERQRLPSIADAYEKGIALFGMTKPFGLAGLRVGWLACRDAGFMQRVSSYKLYTSICNSAPSEVLALIGLRAKEAILGRNRRILLRNLEILDRFFERQRGRLAWVRPQSGTIAFPELLLPVDIDQFNEALVEKAGVLIMPGSIFDYPGNYFRIGFGRLNMPEILDRFEQFLNIEQNSLSLTN